MHTWITEHHFHIFYINSLTDIIFMELFAGKSRVHATFRGNTQYSLRRGATWNYVIRSHYSRPSSEESVMTGCDEWAYCLDGDEFPARFFFFSLSAVWRFIVAASLFSWSEIKEHSCIEIIGGFMGWGRGLGRRTSVSVQCLLLVNITVTPLPSYPWEK